jgi:hypothetical protein
MRNIGKKERSRKVAPLAIGREVTSTVRTLARNQEVQEKRSGRIIRHVNRSSDVPDYVDGGFSVLGKLSKSLQCMSKKIQKKQACA